MKKAYLLLQDDTLYEGYAIGSGGVSGGEICFNTGMTGYQEIYTDPSYAGQIVVNTAAHIGNYGVLDAEQESVHPHIKGIAINEYSTIYSRYGAQKSLHQYLTEHDIVGIAGIDTRALVRHIRDKGAMNAIISSEYSGETLLQQLRAIPSMEGLELASMVSTMTPYEVGHPNANIRIAVLDLGIKRGILRNFERRNCLLKVFPARTPFEEMAAWEPNGYFISNGPGDPAVMDYAIETARRMMQSGDPVFGICLGHQLLALANGIATYKMHHGHRGLNHPVKNLLTGLCEITSQNHGFAISSESLAEHPEVKVTHEHLNDHTIMGICLKDKPVFSVQYHPEASPGPHDSSYLFDDFLRLIKQTQ